MKKLFSFLALMLVAVGAFAQAAEHNSTVVIAKLSLPNSEYDNYGADSPFVIAAFVGNETVPRAVAYPETIWGGDPTTATGGGEFTGYIIRVPSYASDATNNPDVGQPIRFVVGNQWRGLTYAVSETRDFGEDVTYGSAQSPVVFTLNPVEEVGITLREADRGKSYTLANYLKLQPEKGALPTNVVWEAGTYENTMSVTGEPQFAPIDGVTVTNGVLKVSETADVPNNIMTLQLTVQPVSWLQNGQEGGYMAQREVAVVRHATSLTLNVNSFDVENTEFGREKLMVNLIWNQNRPAYTINPEGTTDWNVQWEVESSNNPILEGGPNGLAFIEGKAGTTRVRPVLTYTDGNTDKEVTVYPTDSQGKETWVTLNVTIPVSRIEVNNGLYGNGFVANLSDQNIYERLSRMVTVLPETASNRAFHFEYSGEGLTVSGNKITAAKAGTYTIRVISEGRTAESGYIAEDPTMAVVPGKTVSEEIRIRIENPATVASFAQTTPLPVIIHDDEAVDITKEVFGWIKLNGEAETYNIARDIAVTKGSSVTRSGRTWDDYTFTAQSEGYSTLTVTLTWQDWASYEGIAYDETGAPSADATGPQTVTKSYSFEVNVTKQLTLQRLYASYTEPVAGKEITLTLTPEPQNASFNPADIALSFSLPTAALYGNNAQLKSLFDRWERQVLQSSKVSASQSAIVWKFSCDIPGDVAITASLGTGAQAQNVPIYEGQSPLATVNLGYNLSLEKGWQWRSNPWGYVTPDEVSAVYTQDKLQEIRTQDDLLFNEPGFGMFGSFLQSDGLGMHECYKVQMASPHSAVIYGSNALNLKGLPQNVQYNAQTGVVTVTLSQGWNWVGCPYFYNRSLSKVLAAASLAAQVALPDGLVIDSKNDGFAEYKASATAGGTWEGKLDFLRSGQGYLVYNPSKTLSLSFPVELAWDPADENAGDTSVKGEAMGQGHWQYDHSRFMNNMALVAVLDGIENPQDYSLGAFVGDECRGEGFVQNGKVFVTVHCDAGEYVQFRLYNILSGETLDIQEGLRAQTRVGSLRSPLLLHATTTGIQGTQTEGSATETYDLTGRRQAQQMRGVSIQRTAGGIRKVVVK